MKIFKAFSKVYTTIEKEECNEDLHVKGNYCLLEHITREWYGDADRGLARYLHDDLDKYVKSIQYHYVSDGYICFNVTLNYDSEIIIHYRGGDMTLGQAICDYISGQISDGWGENGILLHDWLKDTVLDCYCSYELYYMDYDASRELAKENGDEFGGFEKYPVYKMFKYYE